MEKNLSKFTLVSGFATAFIAYSCWDMMWKSAYYHLITAAFCLYTFTIYYECNSTLWKRISFAIFISCINALHDELSGYGAIFDYSEYISFLVIIIFIFIPKKNKLL